MVLPLTDHKTRQYLMIPPLLVFVLSQRNVMETMAHAGMKD